MSETLLLKHSEKDLSYEISNSPVSLTRVLGELPCAMSCRAYELPSSESNVSELNANHRAVCPPLSFSSRFSPPATSSRENASGLLTAIAVCNGVLQIEKYT